MMAPSSEGAHHINQIVKKGDVFATNEKLFGVVENLGVPRSSGPLRQRGPPVCRARHRQAKPALCDAGASCLQDLLSFAATSRCGRNNISLYIL